ncbi:MAG TPA: hypothetical protein PKE05_05395 [Microthrixaceae bacterium]|nr:hypothetical protein [Microthrixaceae bacterium]
MLDEDGHRVDLHGYRVDALTDIAIDRLDRERPREISSRRVPTLHG